MNLLKLSHKSASKASFALDVFLLITEVYSKTTTYYVYYLSSYINVIP